MLENLPKLSRDDFLLGNLLVRCRHINSQVLGFISPVIKSLSAILDKPCVVKFLRSSIEPTPEITGTLFLATWPPQAGLFWIELDTKILQNCVYAFLKTPLPKLLDPKLSDLEQGVATYLLARVFEATEDSFQLSDSKELPTGPVVCMSLDFQIGSLKSFARVWVSKPLLESIAQSHSQKTWTHERTHWIEIPLCFELGKIELSQEEFTSLELGDVVILDKGIHEIQAHLGAPAFRTLRGALSTNESKQYQFSIKELL